jgi:hypothetical protein
MRKLKITLVAVMALLFLVGNAHAVMQHFSATVYKKDSTKYGMQGEQSANVIALTGITYKVLVYNSTTAETILSGSGWGTATTSKTNPITTTVYATDGGRIDFYCDPAETAGTYVDLIVTDAAGCFTASVHGFTNKMHSVVIDETPNLAHSCAIWFSGTTTTETSTGIYFLYPTLIEDVRVEVVGVSAAQTLDVGIKNVDPNGLRVGVLLTTAGFVADTAVITGGTSIDYTPVSTYGSLLYTARTGINGGVERMGGRSYLGYVLTSAVTAGNFLTYNNSGATATGYIYVKWIGLR